MSAFSTDMRGGVAVVTFNLPNEPINKISQAVGWELEELLDRLARDEVVKAIVLRSGKPDVFIAGADIEEFIRLRTPDEATRLSRDGQLLMQKVADSTKPVVAAIHGACLGGGLELALACHYRVASDHPKTQLGLPEVQLGLIPGAGGSNRLPRLIGVRAAFDMILTGKNESASKAYRIGLIDELVPESILVDTAVAAAERLARGGKRSKRRRGMTDFALDGTPLGRMLVYRQALAKVQEKTGGALSRAPTRHRGGADWPREWHGQGARRGSRCLRRTGHDRCVAPADRDLLRDHGTQEGRWRAAGHGLAAPGAPARRGGRRIHGRGDRRHGGVGGRRAGAHA